MVKGEGEGKIRKGRGNEHCGWLGKDLQGTLGRPMYGWKRVALAADVHDDIYESDNEYNT